MGNIQAEVSAIRKHMEDCLKRLDNIIEISAARNGEDEEETRSIKPSRWQITTLGIGKGRDLKFDMSFSVRFIGEKRLEKASFLKTEFDDAKHRIYFEFHNDDPGGERSRLDPRTDAKGKPTKGRRTEAIRPATDYNWLIKLRGRQVSDRQFLIEENEDKIGTYGRFSYYISVKGL